jgi:hypothetical protein
MTLELLTETMLLEAGISPSKLTREVFIMGFKRALKYAADRAEASLYLSNEASVALESRGIDYDDQEQDDEEELQVEVMVNTHSILCIADAEDL